MSGEHRDFNSAIERFVSQREAMNDAMPVKAEHVSKELENLRIKKLFSITTIHEGTKHGSRDGSADGATESKEAVVARHSVKFTDSSEAPEASDSLKGSSCVQSTPGNPEGDELSEIMAKINPNNLKRGRNETAANLRYILSEEHVFFVPAQLQKLTVAHIELLLEFVVKVYLNNDDAMLMYCCLLLQKLSSREEHLTNVQLHEQLSNLQTMNVLVAMSLQNGLEAFRPCLDVLEAVILFRDSRARLERFCGVVHSRLLERNTALDLDITFRVMQLLQRVTIHVGETANKDVKAILGTLHKQKLPNPPVDEIACVTRNMDFVTSSAVTMCFEDLLERTRPVAFPKLTLSYGPTGDLLNLLHSFSVTHAGQNASSTSTSTSAAESVASTQSPSTAVPSSATRVFRVLSSLCKLHPHLRTSIMYHEGIIDNALRSATNMLEAYTAEMEARKKKSSEGFTSKLPPTDLSVLRFLEACAEEASFRDVLRAAFSVESFSDAFTVLIESIAMGQETLGVKSGPKAEQMKSNADAKVNAEMLEAASILEAIVVFFLAVYAPNATMYLDHPEGYASGSRYSKLLGGGNVGAGESNDDLSAILRNDAYVCESVRLLGQDIGHSMALLLQSPRLDIPLLQVLCRIVKRLGLSFDLRQDKVLVSKLTLAAFNSVVNGDARKRNYVYALAAFSGWWDDALYDDDRSVLAIEADYTYGVSIPMQSCENAPMSMNIYIEACAKTLGVEKLERVQKHVSDLLTSHDRLLSGLVPDKTPNISLDAQGASILPSLAALTSQDCMCDRWPAFLASRPLPFKRHMHTGLLSRRSTVQEMLVGWEQKNSDELFRQIVYLLGVSRTSGVGSVAFMFSDITALASMLFIIITGQKVEVATSVSEIIPTELSGEEKAVDVPASPSAGGPSADGSTAPSVTSRRRNSSDGEQSETKRVLKKVVEQRHTDKLRSSIGMSLACLHLLLDVLSLHPRAIPNLRPIAQFLLTQLEGLPGRGICSRDGGMDVFAVHCIDALTSLIRIQRQALLLRKDARKFSTEKNKNAQAQSPGKMNPDLSANTSAQMNRRRLESHVQKVTAYSSPIRQDPAQAYIQSLSALQQMVSSRLLAISEVCAVMGPLRTLRPILRLLTEITPALGRLDGGSQPGSASVSNLAEAHNAVLVRFLVMGLRSVSVQASAKDPLPSPIAYASVEMGIMCCEIITSIGRDDPGACREILSRPVVEHALLSLLFALAGHTHTAHTSSTPSRGNNPSLVANEMAVDVPATDGEANMPKPYTDAVMTSYISAVLGALTLCIKHVNVSPLAIIDPYVVGSTDARNAVGFQGRNLYSVPGRTAGVYSSGGRCWNTGIEGLVETMKRHAAPVMPLADAVGTCHNMVWSRLRSNIIVTCKCLQMTTELVHNERNVLHGKQVEEADFGAYRYSPATMRNMYAEKMSDVDKPMYRAAMDLMGPGLIASVLFVMDVHTADGQISSLCEFIDTPSDPASKKHLPLLTDLGILVSSCFSLMHAFLQSDSRPTMVWLRTNILQGSTASTFQMSSLPDMVLRFTSICCTGESGAHADEVYRSGLALLACIVKIGDKLVDASVSRELEGDAPCDAVNTLTGETCAQISEYVIAALRQCEHDLTLYEHGACILRALADTSEEARNHMISSGVFRWMDIMLKVSMENLRSLIPVPLGLRDKSRSLSEGDGREASQATGKDKSIPERPQSIRRKRNGRTLYVYMDAERAVEVPLECMRCVSALGGEERRAEQLYSGGIFDAIYGCLEYCNFYLLSYTGTGGALDTSLPDSAALVLRLFVESLQAIATVAESSPAVMTQIGASSRVQLISHAMAIYKRLQLDVNEAMAHESVVMQATLSLGTLTEAAGAAGAGHSPIPDPMSAYTDLKSQLDVLAKKEGEMNGCPIS